MAEEIGHYVRTGGSPGETMYAKPVSVTRLMSDAADELVLEFAGSGMD
ncbi:MAG: hypothetical protein U0992_06240 [Planctomycetaceae bacterium]